MIQKELNKNEQLFRQLYEAIRGGEIPNGARLSTELELADQYGCSRITVRSSLRRLEELKLIRRVRGNGTYVNSESVRFSGRRNIAVVAVEVQGCGSDEVDPYFAQLMNGLLRGANTYDYSASLIPMRPEDRSFMQSCLYGTARTAIDFPPGCSRRSVGPGFRSGLCRRSGDRKRGPLCHRTEDGTSSGKDSGGRRSGNGAFRSVRVPSRLT